MPIAPIEGWVMDLDGRMIPATPQPTPADGDDYTYRGPLIPRQWVPVAEHDAVLVRLAELEDRLLKVEQIITEWDGD